MQNKISVNADICKRILYICTTKTVLKMLEKCPENVQKIAEKRGKPSTNGTLRFEIQEIILRAPLPVTVKEIGEKLKEIDLTACRQTIGAILKEMQQITNPTNILKHVQRRTDNGISKTYAYYFNKLNR